MTPGPSVKLNSRDKILHLAALLALSSVPFLHSLSFPLLDGWDDHIYVSGNISRLSFSFDNILHWFRTPCEGCFLPLTMMSYMLDHSIWGLAPFGYHLQNLLWHLLAVAALHQLMILSGCSPRLAFLCSLVFAVHPQRAESVVWVSERKDVLCAAFYLWSLLLFLRSGREEGGGAALLFTASLALAISALLSKAMAVSLPLAMLLISVRDGARPDRKMFLRLAPFFAAALVVIPLAIASQDIPQAHLSLPRRTAVALLNIPWYILKTLLPFNLSPIYPRIIPSTGKIAMTAIFYAAAIFAALRMWKDRSGRLHPHNLLIVLCFIVSLAPVSGIVPLGAIDYADRYSYIPSAFLLLFAATMLERFFKEKRAARCLTAAFSAYAAVLAATTYFHAFSWSSYRAVLESAISHEPPPYMALGALADLEFFSGDRSRLPLISEKAISREKGWESDTGVRRLLFKLDILQMRALHEAGNTDGAAKFAKRLKESDLHEFIPVEHDRQAFEKLIDEIAAGSKM